MRAKRISGTNFIVSDGPFAETKELIGGYAIVQGKSREATVEWDKRFLKLVGERESEIRQTPDAPPR